MSVTSSAQRLGGKAAAAQRLASVIEFVGWVGILGAVSLAILVGTHDQTTLSTGFVGVNVATEEQWPLGIAIGAAVALGALMLVVLARALGLLSVYALAQSVETDKGVPPAAGGPVA